MLNHVCRGTKLLYFLNGNKLYHFAEQCSHTTNEHSFMYSCLLTIGPPLPARPGRPRVPEAPYIEKL